MQKADFAWLIEKIKRTAGETHGSDIVLNTTRYHMQLFSQ